MTNEILDGIHFCSEIDNRFNKDSYYYEYENEIFLSLLIVKEKFRNQGVLTDFIKIMQKKNKEIIIPTPSSTVQVISVKLGFLPRHKWSEELQSGFDAMVWKNDTKTFKRR